ncbi:MAG TPA: hypothetical protein VFX78_09475 [Candidatus Eisenbacteria bacterium]|jgi:hypothetical protein|nr:hypothetical protein [Candidatus Eisenbacteria bacterium]
MRSTIRLGTLLIATLVVAAGCSDDEDGGEGGFRPPPRSTVELASPEITLGMLQHAYEARDSVTTARVYDTDYAGTSTDLNDPPGSQTVTFTRGNEISHVGALRKSTTITSVICDLGPPASWVRLPSDDASHPEWALIHISGGFVRIEIADGASIVQAGGPSDQMSFYFTPKPDTTSQTDTLWTVIRWDESRAGVP